MYVRYVTPLEQASLLVEDIKDRVSLGYVLAQMCAYVRYVMFHTSKNMLLCHFIFQLFTMPMRIRL